MSHQLLAPSGLNAIPLLVNRWAKGSNVDSANIDRSGTEIMLKGASAGESLPTTAFTRVCGLMSILTLDTKRVRWKGLSRSP